MNQQEKLRILVEGNTDKAIIEKIFFAANLPLERIEIKVMEGKKKY